MLPAVATQRTRRDAHVGYPGAVSSSDESTRGGVNPVDELLLNALESMTSGDAAVVERLCAEHPELADELRERVQVLRDMQLLPSDAAAMAFPERLGEFRLVRRLGGGGMGVVYEALQEPLGRKVALKLIRPEHLYFERSRERFRRETEAVARLAHPGIVTIHTVGEAQGAPYFAMELIEGATLEHVLEQVAGLAPAALLGSDLRAAVLSLASADDAAEGESPDALFQGTWFEACARIALRVSEALAHAHGRGVLHRDIKPSNIAVTPHGRVVLFDFGLAALDENLRMTSEGTTLGSVLYMAPEQLAGRSAEIDARTDVYALGVTLYELLALESPFARADSLQTRNAILEGRPAPLRARCAAVPRDLEVVCLHAMQHERERRYPTMDAFAADLRNVLAGRPISVRPPSAAYRTRRWIARRPALSAAIALGVLLVTVLPSALYLQQRAHSGVLEAALDAEREARARARLEAGEAEQVATFLVELFASSDPYAAGTRELSAADVLDYGLERVERELAGQPELQARLLERIGESYTNLDEYERALIPLERALALRIELHGERDVRTAYAKVLLASAARLASSSQSEELLRSAIDVLEDDPQSDPERLGNARLLLAMCRTDAGDAREAFELLVQVRAALDAAPDPERARHWSVLAMTASAQRQLGRIAEAEATAREALALDRETRSVGNPWRIAALQTLALCAAQQNRVDEGLALFDELLPQALEMYGANNPVYATMQLERLALLQDCGRHDGLLEQLDALVRTLRDCFGPWHPKTLSGVERLASSLARDGRFAETAALVEELLPELQERLGATDSWWVKLNYRLGMVRTAEGDFARAAAAFESARSFAGAVDVPSRAKLEVAHANVLVREPATRTQARALASSWLDAPDEGARWQAAYVIAIADRLDGAAQSAEAALVRTWERESASSRELWMAAAARILLAELRIERGELAGECDTLRSELEGLERALGALHFEVRDARARCARSAAPCPPSTDR